MQIDSVPPITKVLDQDKIKKIFLCFYSFLPRLQSLKQDVNAVGKEVINNRTTEVWYTRQKIKELCKVLKNIKEVKGQDININLLMYTFNAKAVAATFDAHITTCNIVQYHTVENKKVYIELLVRNKIGF